MTRVRDEDREYPAPFPPMIGEYLVRKKRVAAGLSVVDAVCAAIEAIANRPEEMSDQPHSILVSQCGHLGDLIMALPMLHWIRSNRPQTRIGLIVGSWAKPMLNGIAELYDKYYICDHFMLNRMNISTGTKLARHYSSWRETAAEIKRDKYDAVIEGYPFLQNNIALLRACNIPIRIGFTSGGFGPLLTHPVRWRHDPRPLIDYPRDLLRVLYGDASLDLPLQAYYPKPLLPNKCQSQQYLLVQTGTGNAIKEWPDEHWIELVKNLTAAQVPVVLAGAGSRERARCARIQIAVSEVTNLSDKLTWDEFVALVAGASHVVCLDSSTSHLAASFSIPSTVIMSGTSDPKQFGPANDQASLLTFPTPCAPCFRGHGCDHMACVRQVEVADVTNAIFRRLEMSDVSGAKFI